VDSGRLTPDEAAAHPQRTLLIRALTGNGEAEPDLSLHDAQAGDRYLLCTDGLFGVSSDDRLRSILSAQDDPARTVDMLIELAYAGGAPDNIACVVADVVAA
jgi:PPM family protein phosphatase